MVDQLDTEIPRLDPMAPAEARAEFVRNLKALVAAGSYEVPSDEIALAVLTDLVRNNHCA
ncbi:MAG: flagellar biosynthesis anti-sigma factor FlgM [Acidimicrobiia bacterium]|nr:flagellar biosynthesis anti-sigma factor FlgM [Acidimicrobiia bacterium]